MNTPHSNSLPRITPNTRYDQNGRIFIPPAYQIDWKELLNSRSCTVTDGKYQTLTLPSSDTD